ncbi:hypothetical protein KY289_021321 [Solanum tuberosum]|nr:hypothetical protein KY289_021321 [Solanum tuberosum]
MNTYLISTAKVKVSPTSYGKAIHKFYWVFDKETVIEHIKPSNELEKPLPPPTKLNITTLDRIPHMMVDFAVEIGISILIAIIRLKYTCLLIHTLTTFHYVLYNQIYWQSFFVVVLKNTQVALIISVEKLPFVTIIILWALSWYLVFSPHILRKKQFLLTLWEDFRELERNEIEAKMAIEADLIVILGRSIGICTYHDKTSTSSSAPPMVVTPAGQQVIPIAKMSSVASMGLFYVEAKMAISDEFQEFCLLECSGCKQKTRTKDRKDFECPKCNRKSTLVHRSNNTHATLSILSYMKKEHTPQSTTDRNSKKIRHLEISKVEVMETTTTAGSSNARPKFEPPTPTKKV